MSSQVTTSLQAVNETIKEKLDPLPAVVGKRAKEVTDKAANVAYPPYVGLRTLSRGFPPAASVRSVPPVPPAASAASVASVPPVLPAA